VRIRGRRLAVEAAGVFIVAAAFLLMMGSTAPFTKELGVCESGAVRDVVAGNILLPHFLPGPIVHVPPLYWWLAALCVRMLGWSEIALRLPALIPSGITTALVFAWAAATMNRRTGWWAAIALTLCHFTIDAARQPRMDALLAMFVTAAVICLERALFKPEQAAPIDTLSIQELRAIFMVPPGMPLHRQLVAPEDDHRSRRAPALWFSLGAILIGLGILSKGVLGIVLPGAAIGLYLIASRRAPEIFQPGLIAAFTLGFLIGLGWYIAGYIVDGRQFLQWQLTMNLWHRFMPVEAGGSGYCAHPFWYFVPVTIAGFIPWCGYLPASIAVIVRKWRTLATPVFFALCWLGAIFLFFSASSGKCEIYILPVFAPLAVVIGATLDALQTAASATVVDDLYAPPERPDRLLTIVFGTGTIMIATGAALIVIAAVDAAFGAVPANTLTRLHPTDRRFLEIFLALAARHGLSLYFWLAATIAGVIAALRGLLRYAPEAQMGGVALIAAAGSLFWFGVMNPALAERVTLRNFAQAVTARVPPGSIVGHIGLGDCDLDFYSPAPLPKIFRFRCAEDAALPRYIVLREGAYAAMTPEQRACLKPILASPPLDSQGRRLLVERTN
jgi:4-amino-4-deoxy-L-arabinose transferase-like glycosyltransferase